MLLTQKINKKNEEPNSCAWISCDVSVLQRRLQPIKTLTQSFAHSSKPCVFSDTVSPVGIPNSAMAASALRDQALSLLAAANNHGDLAVKLSSLRQVKEILLLVDPSLSAELFPYLAELQSSREPLVRKSLIEIIEKVGLRMMEHSYVLVGVLLALLRDNDPVVAKQSISSGTKFFCSVVEEMALQFIHRGNVERWARELWTWLVKFKETAVAIIFEPGSVGVKVLALKFMETFVLLFTPEASDSEKLSNEGGQRRFNISWLSGGHPILNPSILVSDANRTVGVLLDLLQSAGHLPGALTTTVVSCLAAVAKKRPVHYNTVLSALLDFHPNLEATKGCHAASVQYSIRTAFLGFLRCTISPTVESRDKLLRALCAMNAADAAEQAIRQADKMIRNNERAARENWSGKTNQVMNHQNLSWDLSMKRIMPQDDEDAPNGEVASKRVCYNPSRHSIPQVLSSDSPLDSVAVNGISSGGRNSDGDLTPVEQMVAMIGALLAEGDRGAESLEILISKLHPDMLADIVITNMKHLPKNPAPLTKLSNVPQNQSTGSLGNPAEISSSPSLKNSMPSPALQTQLPLPSHVAGGSSSTEVPSSNNMVVESRRDPRRDPRRLDPRRANALVIQASLPVSEGKDSVSPEIDVSALPNKSLLAPILTEDARGPAHRMTGVRSDNKLMESPEVPGINQLDGSEDDLAAPKDGVGFRKDKASSDIQLSPCRVDDDIRETECSGAEAKYDLDSASPLEFDQHSPSTSNITASEDTYRELPSVPSYVELTIEQCRTIGKLAIERIIRSHRHVSGLDSNKIRMALLARLIAKIDAGDDVAAVLREHILVDYREHMGHELVLHVLYHLHSTAMLDTDESPTCSTVYETFLIAVARSLLDVLPASDKSFSRLFGEAPHLPDSAIKLLDDLCSSSDLDPNGREVRDSERVTQGLGAVWSLVIGRPNERQACLAIALKSSVHSEDDIRAKAIRLVTNKLYHLTYVSQHIEQFATDMLLTAVNSETDFSQAGVVPQRVETEVENQRTSTSTSQVISSGTSDVGSQKDSQPSLDVSAMSFPEAQRLTSLFFALCKKKPSLLHLVFEVYGRAPKPVKQAFHRHIPILIRALGSSYSELLQIVSDPPAGSENLLTLVLQVLTQETLPPPDLIATVKHLYETKLKDVSILIPLLSSLSKDEVLPIFPRLVNLPLDKFQMALAHILQGSAHTGPALTPAEVLIAIHGIVPEKDGPPLKKITDACSACFEQRTVFTQQVLAKALSQMVDQTPLPLLFMRTVIQAIDAFPKLVDFVMEILSKLVSKQIWKLPKLWVGFVKCVSQTQPHSYPVLLKLPPTQLENTLAKYPNLKPSLAVYANKPTVKASLPSSTLVVLGMPSEQDLQPLYDQPLHPSDASSSIHGATLT
ncbi:PREDICTED: uncharacterized protein LOC104825811 [Tarenaya hassleriana]|uniref:uncharacterized protein LOC104825811 n=1 Tax=Tarenaya hassleriana TaxID=28532 RepID=UPI0008FD5F6A|nr:PREDICTED: uncharacterized protein LOC104825811 [Tarenaya hassleriana]